MNNTYSRRNGKIFYAVIAISVLSVLAAAIGIRTTIKKIRSSAGEPTQTTADRRITEPVSDTQANKRETGIADDRTEKATDEVTTSEAQTKNTQTTAAAVTQKTVNCTLPLSSDILKDYSNGTPVKSKTMNDWRTHNGVDFTGETGDEIRAVCGGTVKEITNDASWGNVVVIDHENGMTARYCGFQEVSVKEGENVMTGDAIGTLGSIPVESADAPHLHFETMKNGIYTDPVEALSIQRDE